MNRAMHITQNSIQVKDETLRDTLIDLHNYAAMAIMESEPAVPNLPRNSSISEQNLTVPTQNPGSEPPNNSDILTPSQRAALPYVRKSISDPPRNEAFDDCNHRNINLR